MTYIWYAPRFWGLSTRDLLLLTWQIDCEISDGNWDKNRDILNKMPVQ
jgi:hypothetical protein